MYGRRVAGGAPGSRVATLALAAAFALVAGGCSFGNTDCNLGSEECQGSSGAYRVCGGGEGYYSWDSKQCPGLAPVCTDSDNANQRISCTDSAAPSACAAAATLLDTDAGFSNLPLVADMDGDGVLDLLEMSPQLPLRVALGSGGGQFEPPRSVTVSVSGQLLSAFPANLDGRPPLDLVVTSLNPAEIYAFTGAGGLNYTLSARYFLSNPTTLSAAADLDGDGIDEVVGASTNEGLHVFSALGSSSLGDRLIDTSTPNHYGADAVSAVVTNFDGKPPLDLGVFTLEQFEVFLGQPDQSHLRAASVYRPLAVGDLDGDGLADLVAIDSETTLRIHLADGKGGFSSGVSLSLPYPPSAAAIGDFNGDHLPDIFVFDSAQQSKALLGVFLGLGGARFQAPSWLNWSLKQGENFAVADIDGDGRSDLITNAPDGSVVLLAHGCVTP